MQAITVDHLSKEYRTHQREAGLRNSLRSLFRREYRTVQAVQDVSFAIAPGEIVGFLGPNGAGKTTTLKVLSGLLYPTTGQVTVLGHTPHRREHDYLSKITLVMGQRNQLFWDLPAMETFLVNQAIYGIPEADFRATLTELTQLLEIEPLLIRPVRKLSLGERMKCELAACLLHRPNVLFLDEPTIGLDVNAQVAMRAFLQDYNRRHGTTILLTSHYMADVTALARRVLVIEEGRLIYDGDLQALVEREAPYKLLRLRLQQPLTAADLNGLGEIETNDGLNLTLRVPRGATKAAATHALTNLPVEDVMIEEPPIEQIIGAVFRGIRD
jgi:ABC-2 type transport system ATP-binding protein